MTSRIVMKNGVPRLFSDGKEIAANCYMTYFDENADYDSFREAGFSLFSVCAYLTGLPINETTGFTPSHFGGIFDRKGKPNFSEFDNNVEDLLRRVPNALFFPRIYLSMPLWWIKENPESCGPAGVTAEGRELLFSEGFRRDGKILLTEFIRHTESMPYADHIIGYQVSGGNTQEWFHFFPAETHPKTAYPYFADYYERKYGTVPDKNVYLECGYYREFLDFMNDSDADTVGWFAKAVKELTDRKKIVGAFFGYSIEVNNAWRGSQSLYRLLDSPDIDFFSSPISYYNNRSFEKEWCSMLPENSVLLHGKAVLTEADVRTHLSRYPDECRPDITIVNLYRHPIWFGGPTEEDSVKQIRRAFVKNVCTVHGLWWFDMWGGWYKTPKLLAEMKRYHAISEMETQAFDSSRFKIAVLIDETFPRRKPGLDLCHNTVEAVAESGIPYDLYLVTDLDRIAGKYPLYLLAFDPAGTEVEKVLTEKSLSFILPCSSSEIRKAGEEAGIVPLTQTSDILYLGNGFLGLYALSAGEKIITIPEGYTAVPVLGDRITITGQNAICRLPAFASVLLKLNVNTENS